MNLRRLWGARGERVAGRYLRRRGHRLLLRNYRTPIGEIDLITLDGDTVVFVEVKTRSSNSPVEAVLVRAGQWQSLERTARQFLREHARGDPPCRFDVVSVVFSWWGRARVEHFADAHPLSR